MNHIKNKADLETTISEIRTYAYNYLEKYSTSKQQLRIYLFKRYLKKNQKKTNKKELFDLIDAVIQSLEDQQLISDKYYSNAGTVNNSVWDGRDQLGQVVTPGTYIMHIESMNPVTGETQTDAAPIVVGVKN